ncbi:hypothetical protein RUND412_003935 [Rhizina undulata]
MFKPSLSTLRTFPIRTLPRVATGAFRRQFNSSAVSKNPRLSATATAVGALGGFVLYQIYSSPKHYAEAPAGESMEEQKTKFSSQHGQIKNSWEHPGVYAWGSNSGKAVAPDSKEDVVKSPRRIKFFDNIVLRDLKLGRDCGVAVTEDGDILQWGIAYAPGVETPEKTLTGKNIIKVELSDDRIFALGKDGKIYSLPQSKQIQLEGYKPIESSWVPGVTSESPIHYRLVKPELGTFESVKDISSGLDHLLILTSNGRLFSSAASSTFPDKGQMGIPGLTLATRPRDAPYDVCHEVKTVHPMTITQIATGDRHSVFTDSTGTVYVFGDNTSGQLGFVYNAESDIIPVPTLLPMQFFYSEKNVHPKVTKIAAGGANTFFLIDVDDNRKYRRAADVFACGNGIWGNLGNGRWTHVQAPPSKVKVLSGLYEFDDDNNKIVPIRVKALAVGKNHTCAILGNKTYVDASTAPNSSIADVNYGSDVMIWGNNEFYQLGTGKRNNTCVPVYINPLDPVPPELEIHGGLTGSRSTAELARRSGLIDGVDYYGKFGAGMDTGGKDSDEVHRFQVAPKKKVEVPGNGKKEIEQRVVCGNGTTGVYSGV